MKIMILGANGQLGTEFSKMFAGESIAFSRAEVNICDVDSVNAALTQHQVDFVINAAAYNQVDQAEDEPQVAYQVNAIGPRNLAIACSQNDACLVHVSSDYVFGRDRSKSPWLESDCPGPISAYGVSKLAGEQFVRALAPKHFVVRTCGLYGHAAIASSGKSNFVETMLKLGQSRSTIRVVDDQHCTPTSTKDLASAIASLMQTENYGLYHATNSGECTWARFAEEIFRLANLRVQVEPISSSEYVTAAKRPAYSLLNCDKVNGLLPIELPHWKDSLSRYIKTREI